ncbi:MAG: hypothetical protein JNN12_04745 [Bacteroidetes Order II. Incertae sedis bacterium]|nr:hypothetical protein [Bacteroidetes Order II. bacterium]
MLKAKGCRLLLLDGTTWDFNGGHIHYLVLSILVRGVSIPIYFADLEKAGASNQEERTTFIKRVLGKLCIEGMTLIADREYVGEDWF